MSHRPAPPYPLFCHKREAPPFKGRGFSAVPPLFGEATQWLRLSHLSAEPPAEGSGVCNGTPPARPTSLAAGFSVCGSRAHSAPALTPALTLPGSLSPARGVLTPFAACGYVQFARSIAAALRGVKARPDDSSAPLLCHPNPAPGVGFQERPEVVAPAAQLIAAALVAVQYRQHPLHRAARLLHRAYGHEQRASG